MKLEIILLQNDKFSYYPDNLGATVDLNILNFIHSNDKEFVMEVSLLSATAQSTNSKR